MSFCAFRVCEIFSFEKNKTALIPSFILLLIIALTKASPSLNYVFLIKTFRLQQNERELKNAGDTELNFSAIEFIYK